MQLSKYTSGIIFVDDKYEQVKPLIEFCEEQVINVRYINPIDFDPSNLYIGYRIVFMDLAFDDGNVDVARVTNMIRGISENGDKHLLVVAWTQHETDIENLKTQIENVMVDNLPLAILNAQKSLLLDRKTKEDFTCLISDIFDEFIENNHNLFNLLEWKENYFKSINEEFHDLMIKTYSDKIEPSLIDKRLGLYAANTLAPFKVLSALEVLNVKVSDNSLSKLNLMDETDLDYDPNLLDFQDRYKFNHDMMFDKKIELNDIPGSIYKIKEYTYEELNTTVSNTNLAHLVSELKRIDIKFTKILHVLINLTPNCTYASEHKNTTYCEGYLICNIDSYQEKFKKLINNMKGYSLSCKEKDFFSYFNINDGFCHLIICFDLCQSYNNEDNTKILQLKNNIKLSVQQHYSSWISRVGDVLNHR